MVDDEDLRLALAVPLAEWDAHDVEVANAAIARALRTVRGMVGGLRVDRAVAIADADLTGAVDEATLVLATARFSNPESWLQARQGSDRSVSFADSNESATGRREAQAILREAFGLRIGTTNL